MPNYADFKLIGHLTRDPEIKIVNETASVCEVGIAVNEYRKEGKDHTSFFELVAWNKTGELLGSCSKGDPVFVSGRPTQERWEKDGENRSKVKFVVREFQFLKKKEEAPAPASVAF